MCGGRLLLLPGRRVSACVRGGENGGGLHRRETSRGVRLCLSPGVLADLLFDLLSDLVFVVLGVAVSMES